MAPFVELTEEDVQKSIQAYKGHINRNLKGMQIDRLLHIQDFFLMKNPDVMPAEKTIRYMSIDNKEQQNRTQPLKLPQLFYVGGF